jgi:YD repeat-containing protein
VPIRTAFFTTKWGDPSMNKYLKTSAVIMAVLIYGMIWACSVCRAETVKFSYDEQGRLTSATYGSSGSIQYEYDAAGNVVTAQETVTIATAVDSAGDDAKDRGPMRPQSLASAACDTDPLVP